MLVLHCLFLGPSLNLCCVGAAAAGSLRELLAVLGGVMKLSTVVTTPEHPKDDARAPAPQ
jgi:hypothetical protein